jgi:hypothetical protein
MTTHNDYGVTMPKMMAARPYIAEGLVAIGPGFGRGFSRPSAQARALPAASTA